MMKINSAKCAHPTCGCSKESTAGGFRLARRDFLRLLGAGTTVALAVPPWTGVMAGPFTRADFEKLVPVDKKLSPEWVRSLAERGQPAVYRGTELTRIGMPIGGLCAGQLYLGGDGRLWHWDIFNRQLRTGAEHYAKPLPPSSPLEQGFALRLASPDGPRDRLLDAVHWQEVTFNGQYPIGRVTYSDPDCPVSVRLEAFSPFIPLQADESSLPATILEFTLKNNSQARVEGELAGWLENAVCLDSARNHEGCRRMRIVRDKHLMCLEASAEPAPAKTPSAPRADILFADFESDTYGDWTATGSAFGPGPVEAARMPDYQGDVKAKGKRLVNSHASAPGSSVGEKDAVTGRLTSRSFVIERNYITFLIGGGNHAGRTCMNLVVDEQVVLSATGAANNQLAPAVWEVRSWLGRTARLVIVDEESGGWGNIGVDDIVFTDHPRPVGGPLAERGDFGTLGLSLLEPESRDAGNPCLPETPLPGAAFAAADGPLGRKPFGGKLVGALRRRFKLAPGRSVRIVFVLTWFFPNLDLKRLPRGRFYGTRFGSARAVAAFVARHFERLAGQTRLWHDTWYDSTLPYWFLDRTFLNTSILATSTCYRLADGRFYSWEGVGCCEGTCGHVWQYAQAVARLFPELERGLREQVDFGIGLQPDGAIHFRGEFNDIPAIDAQAGTILRTLREHQMSPDGGFLKRNWPACKKAVEWLIAQDENGDGLIECHQHNTLDTDWFGPVAWLSGLYLAALQAAETMALELGDHDFATRCRGILANGQKNLVTRLFDREYFTNRVDSRHLEAINSGTGCEIDQVMGQSWAFQVGLPRVLPQVETQAALRALWRYNYTPDVGPYREAYKAGRWYAMPGEAGLLMCTFPRADWDYAQAKGKGPDWAAGYFNECMNGFEYQVAGHMLWEGLVMEGLAITRAVHDRYHPARRNPWNEVECGDHYVRSMASYGVFLAACGYEHHGPKGHLGFAPRLMPEHFRAAFTTAEGWGSYGQQRAAGEQLHTISLKWGTLRLRTFSAELPPGTVVKRVRATLGGKRVGATVAQQGARVVVTFDPELQIKPSRPMEIALDF